MKKIMVGISAAVLACCVSGCASFPNREVAVVNAFPRFDEGNSKPSVFLEAGFYRGEPGANGTCAIGVDRRKEIADVLNASGLFGQVSYNPLDKDAMDYILSVESYNHYGDLDAASLGGFITGLTLFIIPSKATDHYMEVVKLKDHSGNVISSASNKDSISTWFGIWFLPWCGNTPGKAFSKTLDNQLKAALVELANNGSLQ